MRKLFYSLALCLTCGIVNAQNGFFLQPFAGGGVTNIAYKYDGRKLDNLENAVTYNGGVLAGFRENNWVFATGLQYLRTGYKININYFGQLSSHPISSGLYTYFNHPAIPLSVGYTFFSDKQVLLTPSAGVAVSYNVSGSQSVEGQKTRPIPDQEFKNEYVPLSCFGFVKLDADFYLSDRLSLIVGPSGYYMATNFAPTHNLSSYPVKLHTYAFLLNVGLKWQPGKKDHGPEDDETEPE